MAAVLLAACTTAWTFLTGALALGGAICALIEIVGSAGEFLGLVGLEGWIEELGTRRRRVGAIGMLVAPIVGPILGATSGIEQGADWGLVAGLLVLVIFADTGGVVQRPRRREP